MNTTISQKTIGIGAYLYLLLIKFIGNTVSLYQQKLTSMQEDRLQKNAFNVITWIFILLTILVAGVTFIAMQWACSKFANGRAFSGDYNILGAHIKIGCI
ncbi:hypothetical protein [Bacillus sp. CDB3]|uniref:hypothetical protein n=1 Tax=Bacillus sp. CDB3 TaxID=360310 RepID=UPI0009D8F7E8|nr:hypothetical protein [Bacillus sp. CDB3]OQR53439.1 hypothetical protein CDB3_29830 [Bacillus sp. CDB3]